MDIQKVGNQIATLRKRKGITQNDLGERLGVSFQAVSKWERGETLPDTALLPDLAEVLESTVDYILTGGEKLVYRGRTAVTDMIDGLRHIQKAGECLGKDNLIYRCAIDGINTSMNTDIEECFSNDYAFEAFVAEAVIQNLKNGAYVDVTDVKINFKHKHFRNIVLSFCEKYGIK